MSKIFKNTRGLENNQLFERWNKLVDIRQKVNVSIEEKRSSKIIGSSLEAEVEINLPKVDFELLRNIDANELFIVSNVIQNLSSDKKMSVVVKKAKGSKCVRCWKIVAKIQDGKCSRCLKIK